MKKSKITESVNINPRETIYVDKITDVGVGPSVTRLTLSQEVTSGSSKSFANLVMPTSSFFQFVRFASDKILSNDDLKQQIINSLDQLRSELTAIEETDI